MSKNHIDRIGWLTIFFAEIAQSHVRRVSLAVTCLLLKKTKKTRSGINQIFQICMRMINSNFCNQNFSEILLLQLQNTY